jgi:hypothetical protein
MRFISTLPPGHRGEPISEYDVTGEGRVIIHYDAAMFALAVGMIVCVLC